jgi:hypothetical protein
MKVLDDGISECDCERLRGDFTALRSTYQERHGLAYDDYRISIEEEIKTDPESFARYADLKKKRVGHPSVINFEGQSGTGSQEICDLFVRVIERTNANKPWVPSDPRLDDVSDEPPFVSLQFTVLEVLTALLDFGQ